MKLLAILAIGLAVGCATTPPEIPDIPIYNDGLIVEERRASDDDLQAMLNR